MGERMGATRGTLTLLRALAERPMTRRGLLDFLEDSGLRRDERTLRRWLEALREAGFEVGRDEAGRYRLRGSPVRLAFDGREALATLSVLESLAVREPAYGAYLASAAAKLREALPEEALRFADAGTIQFELNSASEPPEDPDVIDTLRRATHQHRRVEILYHSLRSDTVRRRTVEPVLVSYAQNAHRLYAYDPEQNRVAEFRVNRIREASPLPNLFSPQSHRQTLARVEVRLSQKAFTALGKTVVPDTDATIEPTQDGGAIVAGTTPSVFWTVRDLASLGPEAEVLGGPQLKQELLRFLHQTLRKYDQEPQ